MLLKAMSWTPDGVGVGATDGVVGERCRTVFSGRTGTRARHENERKDGNGRSDENGVRTSPKSDVLDEGCTQLLH